MRASAMFIVLALAVIAAPQLAHGACMTDSSVEAFFEGLAGAPLPTSDSCCQKDVCGIPCPADHPKPPVGFAVGIGIVVVIFCAIGLAAFYFIGGKAENFFVAGRSLPLYVVILTLASQSIDSNALLGNADLSYKYHFWDGAVLPIGLGLSLILNGLFLAHHVNNEMVLTLPDIYAKRYGVAGELAASVCTCVSFLCLLAGNLVGMGAIVGYIFGVTDTAAVFISGFICLAYVASGGLFSVAYTDVVQSVVGMIGCLAVAFWLIGNSAEEAPPPSIGFPNAENASAVAGWYMYPDDATAALYDGVPCEIDSSAKCYNQQLHCPDGGECIADNGAYPFGDQRIFDKQMTDPYSLTPFPNAIFWNWATIFILGFGNLAALDFQARCMAAKSPLDARMGCILGGLLTFLVGIPFSYLGAITRYYYGPDSIYAEFEADTCSAILDLPQCAMWKPDSKAFIKLLTTKPPAFLGGWGLLGIVAASMSTSDGAILALGTVFSHNILRSVAPFSEERLLTFARFATVPFALIAMLLAAFYQSEHPAGATGYLLIVAFDVVLAGCIVPLFACFYMEKPSPTAGLAAIVGGTLMRLILEFSLPKDGFLLLPYSKDEFLDYGTPRSDLYPGFFDVGDANKWDSSTCEQTRFKDFTGVDSLASPAFSLVVFLVVHYWEKARGSPLINSKYLTPYTKQSVDAVKPAIVDKL